jgi:hypothetical protein
VTVGHLVPVSAVLAGLLAACGGTTATPGASGTPAGPGTGSPTASAAPTEAPLVRYARSGGIAGRHEELTISPGGDAVLRRDGAPAARGALTRTERSALSGALGDAGLPPGTRTRHAGPPDGFTYTVTVGSATVEFGENDVPADVAGLLRVLQGVADRLAR